MSIARRTAPAIAVLAAAVPAHAGPVSCDSCWKPRPTTRAWQLQLQGTVDTRVNAPVFDIDGADNGADVVRALHRKGARVICYFSGGSWEDWRRDKGRFPASVKGKDLDGWPGEKWLDIRRIDILGPIMRDRMRACKRRGYDAVDPDNVNAYEIGRKTGFPITAAHQLRYNRWLADRAHELGLSIGLKNDVDQVDELLPWFDFQVNEQCFLYEECGKLRPFVRADKAVYNVEYELPRSRFCSKARAMRFSSIRKKLDLRAHREPC